MNKAFLLLVSLLTFKGVLSQSKIESIQVSERSLLIQNVLICEGDRALVNSIDSIKKAFPKNKKLSHKEKISLNTNLYLLDSGLEFVFSPNNTLIKVNIHFKSAPDFNRKVKRKMRYFSGHIDVNLTQITSKTIFSDLKRLKNFTSCLDNGARNVIYLNCTSELVSIVFESDAEDAQIRYISLDLY
jgi:hypothetical protein